MVMGFEGFAVLPKVYLPFRITLCVAAGNSPSFMPNLTPYLERSFSVLQRAFYSLYVTWPQTYTLFQFGTFLSPWLKDSVFSLVECFQPATGCIKSVFIDRSLLVAFRFEHRCHGRSRRAAAGCRAQSV